jgi:Fe-S-cluster containining protein
MGKQAQKDCGLLYLWRKKDVYRLDMPRFQGIVAIGTNMCKHVTKNGRCAIHSSKPNYCKEFPLSSLVYGLCILPKKCSARTSDCIILENMQKLNEHDLIS